jgi:hypothetical protein
MASREHQAEEVVTGRVFEQLGRIRLLLYGLGLARQFLVLLRLAPVAAEHVDRAALGDGREPCAGIVRDAVLGPLIQRAHQRVLRQVLGEPDIADHARQTRYQLGRFDPPDGVDGAGDVGGRHGRRSNHTARMTRSWLPVT